MARCPLIRPQDTRFIKINTIRRLPKPHHIIAARRLPSEKKKKTKNLNLGELTLRPSKSTAITLTGCNQELHGGAPFIGPPPGYTCSPAPALPLGWATARTTRGAFSARSSPGPPVRLGTPGPPGILLLKHSAQAPHLPAHLPFQARDHSDPSPHGAQRRCPRGRHSSRGSN